jgi:hypothetical protein
LIVCLLQSLYSNNEVFCFEQGVHHNPCEMKHFSSPCLTPPTLKLRHVSIPNSYAFLLLKSIWLFLVKCSIAK